MYRYAYNYELGEKLEQKYASKRNKTMEKRKAWTVASNL